MTRISEGQSSQGAEGVCEALREVERDPEEVWGGERRLGFILTSISQSIPVPPTPSLSFPLWLAGNGQKPLEKSGFLSPSFSP